MPRNLREQIREQMGRLADIFTFGIEDSQPTRKERRQLQKDTKGLYKDLDNLVSWIRQNNELFPDNIIPIRTDLTQNHVPPFIRDFFQSQIEVSPEKRRLYIVDTGTFSNHRGYEEQELMISLREDRQEISYISIFTGKIYAESSTFYCNVEVGFEEGFSPGPVESQQAMKNILNVLETGSDYDKNRAHLSYSRQVLDFAIEVMERQRPFHLSELAG